jgi:hypothetical protein
MSSVPARYEVSGERRKPKPSGSTSSAPSPQIGSPLRARLRSSAKTSSCLRSLFAPSTPAFSGHLQQLADVQGLEFGQVERGNVGIAGRGRGFLAAVVDVEQIVLVLRILGGITVPVARAATTGTRGTAGTGRSLVRLRCCCQ